MMNKIKYINYFCLDGYRYKPKDALCGLNQLRELLSTPQEESSELSKDNNNLRGQLEPPVNGSEEARGGRKRQQRTITTMDNQLTPPDRAKTAHYARQTSFDCQDDKDDKQRTAENEDNDLKTIATVLAGAEKNKWEPLRPPPPPEPPQLSPRRPWPRTNNTFAPANFNGTAHGGSVQTKGPAKGIQSFPWQGTTPSRIKTTPDKWKQ